jgi:hypothetical protein
MKTHILPRQARDKHTGNKLRKRAFRAPSSRCGRRRTPHSRLPCTCCDSVCPAAAAITRRMKVRVSNSRDSVSSRYKTVATQLAADIKQSRPIQDDIRTWSSDLLWVRKTASFFRVSLVFVPSLSWQNDRFLYINVGVTCPSSARPQTSGNKNTVAANFQKYNAAKFQ